MGKGPTSDLPSLVDAFVSKINREPRGPEFLDDVSAFLREEVSRADLESLDRWTTSCHIVGRDNSTRIDELESGIERRFLPSSSTSGSVHAMRFIRWRMHQLRPCSSGTAILSKLSLKPDLVPWRTMIPFRSSRSPFPILRWA